MDEFDILDPRFRPYVLPNAPLVKLGEGFAWLEGPVWFADQDLGYELSGTDYEDFYELIAAEAFGVDI